MRTIILRAAAAIVALFTLSTAAHAQFENDKAYIGPHIGLGAYESALSFGGDFEYALTRPGEAGSGRISIGASVDYSSWSSSSTNSTYYWSYSWVPIGVYSAYHFALSNRKIDLYAGLGLGYTIVNSTWHGSEGEESSSASYRSGVYLQLVGGIRYFFTPGFAFHAKAGLGAAPISVGVNFAL